MATWLCVHGGQLMEDVAAGGCVRVLRAFDADGLGSWPLMRAVHAMHAGLAASAGAARGLTRALTAERKCVQQCYANAMSWTG
jgi:hypothetical protein